MRYLVNLSYNGSKFYGYQIQKNNITVEGELESILSKIFNEKINTIGSSRTDRKVHALDQYCHFDSDKLIDTEKLTYSINSMINEDIYIKSIKIDNNIHARYSTIRKEYIYKINMGEYNPIEREYVFQYNKIINESLIKDFISKMNGEHNFKSFTSDKNNGNYIRNVNISYNIEDNKLYLKFSSSGFLRYMIRNIVGLLLDINDGKKNIKDIDYIFNCEDRCKLGRCASPCGLYLNYIELSK